MEAIEVLPIRVRVTAILRKALMAGEYQPGEELSLTEVAAKLGVSRTPVREAFQTLAGEGLLELRMNRGAVVVGIDESTIRDHFDLRILLECEAVRRAILDNMDVTDLLVLQEKAERGGLSEEQYRSYNQTIHTSIWKHAGNKKLYDLLVAMWNGPSASVSGRDPDHEAKSIREHRQLLTFIQAQDINRARTAMRIHLERSMNNIVASFRAAHTKEK